MSDYVCSAISSIQYITMKRESEELHYGFKDAVWTNGRCLIHDGPESSLVWTNGQLWSQPASSLLQDNLVLCMFIDRYTKMKTATNIYIFNLALADALVTTTMPFQSTDYLLNTWPFGEVVCKVFISIDYYNMFTSIFTLTMMSVDRYVAVCHPVKALDFRTPIKAKMINVCIWILSSAAGIPAFVLGGTQTKSGEEVLPFSFSCPGLKISANILHSRSNILRAEICSIKTIGAEFSISHTSCTVLPAYRRC